VLFAVLIAALSIPIGVVLVGRVVEHSKWFRNVNNVYMTMYDNPPPNVDRGLWKEAVYWIINLHGNCAGTREDVPDLQWRYTFLCQLQERIATSDYKDIFDWIWNEYSTSTKNGATYRTKYFDSAPRMTYK
jgi:hypothetical protein